MKHSSRFYWLKSNGEIIEIHRDKALKFEKNHLIIWKAGNDIAFIGKEKLWYPIESLKKIIN